MPKGRRIPPFLKLGASLLAASGETVWLGPSEWSIIHLEARSNGNPHVLETQRMPYMSQEEKDLVITNLLFGSAACGWFTGTVSGTKTGIPTATALSSEPKDALRSSSPSAKSQRQMAPEANAPSATKFRPLTGDQ